MILYNVTVSIDPAIQDDWLQWMRETHIPDVMRTGMFLQAQINQVLSEEDTGVTFAIQYTCESKEMLDQYQSVFAPALQAEHTQRYNGKFGAFRTLLQIIEKFEA